MSDESKKKAGLPNRKVRGLFSFTRTKLYAPRSMGFYPVYTDYINLDKQDPDPKAEGRRCSYLQILAVFSGVITAFLDRDYMPPEIEKPTESLPILGLGLPASGVSGFWNQCLSLVGEVKKAKQLQTQTLKLKAQ